MLMFLLGILMLLGGYYTYGKFIESILGPDDRETPAKTSRDGVDYLVLPHWKNMLIHVMPPVCQGRHYVEAVKK